MTKRLILTVALCGFLAIPAIADQYGTTIISMKEQSGLTVEIQTSQDSWLAAVFGEAAATRPNEYAGITYLNSSALVPSATPLPEDAYANFGKVLTAFCVDLYDQKPAILPPSEYDVLSLEQVPDRISAIWGMGDANAKRIAKILQTYDYYESDEMAAAVQIAIWEVLDEENTIYSRTVDGLDVTTGDFQLIGNAGIAALANEILGSLGDVSGVDYSRYIAVSSPDGKGGYQDFVVVPVPAAVLLGLLGLSAAGVRLRKRA